MLGCLNRVELDLLDTIGLYYCTWMIRLDYHDLLGMNHLDGYDRAGLPTAGLPETDKSWITWI